MLLLRHAVLSSIFVVACGDTATTAPDIRAMPDTTEPDTAVAVDATAAPLDVETVACTDGCTVAGARRCSGTQVETCGDSDGDGCLDWGASEACGQGLVCANGFCALACEDACSTVGATKCDANAVATCGDFDDDGCLEWGQPTACSGTESCSNGRCAEACVSECPALGATRCDGAGVSTCGDTDADPCREWGTVVPCGEGLTCSNGACAATCSDECATSGQAICSGAGSVVTCGNFDADSCLELGSPVSCGAAEVCLAGACEARPPAIIINEIVVDNSGNPDPDTFIELRGPPGTALAGYTLVGINGNGGAAYATITLDGAMPSDGLFVVAHPGAKPAILGEADQTDVKADLQNGPDSVQLRYGATLVDALGYGTFAANDTFAGEGHAAPKPGIDQALSRLASGADTNDNAADFVLATASPGALSATTPTCSDECSVAICETGAARDCGQFDADACRELGQPVACAADEACIAGACKPLPSGIVINELVVDTAGTPDTDTFVELHGPAGKALAGYRLVAKNGNGGATYATIALTGSIPADGFFVVAHPQASAAIHAVADQSDAHVDLQNGPDSLELRDAADALVDAVGYGIFGASDSFAGEGHAAPTPALSRAITRDAASSDTNDNAADFRVAMPTPGVAALACGDTCDAAGAPERDGDETVLTCGDGDGDGCVELIGNACAPNQTCTGGACVCVDGCPSTTASECNGGQTRSCGVVDGCLAWSAWSACASGSCASVSACFAEPDLVVAEDTFIQLCGTHVYDEVDVYGHVSCASGELRIEARRITLHDDSVIFVSGNGGDASGQQSHYCQVGQPALSAGAGGGGGSAGDNAQDAYARSGQFSCQTCSGAKGGAVRGSDWNIDATRGGKGGAGCNFVLMPTCQYPGYESVGGLGGGTLVLVARERLTMNGWVQARGEPGGGPPPGLEPGARGAGGGGGGTVVLIAPAIETSGGTIATEGGGGWYLAPEQLPYCTQGELFGADGGAGRVKALYSEGYYDEGTVLGASARASWMPPLGFTVAVDGVAHTGGAIDAAFASIAVTWPKPYEAATGYWYRLGKDSEGRVQTSAATYTAANTVTLPRAAFDGAGTFYLHVVSVHGASVGTLSNHATLQIAP